MIEWIDDRLMSQIKKITEKTQMPEQARKPELKPQKSKARDSKFSIQSREKGQKVNECVIMQQIKSGFALSSKIFCLSC